MLENNARPPRTSRVLRAERRLVPAATAAARGSERPTTIPVALEAVHRTCRVARDERELGDVRAALSALQSHRRDIVLLTRTAETTAAAAAIILIRHIAIVAATASVR